ncbi:MAG: hypothetical protein GW941_00745 [Candidatus Pacebacteria bacterium]|nr:hypothetical protein [Candidatus Paceibacterota bacterium]
MSSSEQNKWKLNRLQEQLGAQFDDPNANPEELPSYLEELSVLKEKIGQSEEVSNFMIAEISYLKMAESYASEITDLDEARNNIKSVKEALLQLLTQFPDLAQDIQPSLTNLDKRLEEIDQKEKELKSLEELAQARQEVLSIARNAAENNGLRGSEPQRLEKVRKLIEDSSIDDGSNIDVKEVLARLDAKNFELKATGNQKDTEEELAVDNNNIDEIKLRIAKIREMLNTQVNTLTTEEISALNREALELGARIMELENPAEKTTKEVEPVEDVAKTEEEEKSFVDDFNEDVESFAKKAKDLHNRLKIGYTIDLLDEYFNLDKYSQELSQRLSVQKDSLAEQEFEKLSDSYTKEDSVLNECFSIIEKTLNTAYEVISEAISKFKDNADGYLLDEDLIDNFTTQAEIIIEANKKFPTILDNIENPIKIEDIEKFKKDVSDFESNKNVDEEPIEDELDQNLNIIIDSIDEYNDFDKDYDADKYIENQELIEKFKKALKFLKDKREDDEIESIEKQKIEVVIELADEFLINIGKVVRKQEKESNSTDRGIWGGVRNIFRGLNKGLSNMGKYFSEDSITRVDSVKKNQEETDNKPELPPNLSIDLKIYILYLKSQIDKESSVDNVTYAIDKIKEQIKDNKNNLNEADIKKIEVYIQFILGNYTDNDWAKDFKFDLEAYDEKFAPQTVPDELSLNDEIDSYIS